MATDTLTRSDDALMAHGELYRDAEGHEVWRIRNTDGTVYVEGIASDFDAEWLADQMVKAQS
jgi:hypothetical protein